MNEWLVIGDWVIGDWKTWWLRDFVTGWLDEWKTWWQSDFIIYKHFSDFVTEYMSYFVSIIICYWINLWIVNYWHRELVVECLSNLVTEWFGEWVTCWLVCISDMTELSYYSMNQWLIDCMFFDRLCDWMTWWLMTWRLSLWWLSNLVVNWLSKYAIWSMRDVLSD